MLDEGSQFLRINRRLLQLASPFSEPELVASLETYKRLWLRWQDCEHQGGGPRFADALDVSSVGDSPSTDALVLFVFLEEMWRFPEAKDEQVDRNLRDFAKWTLEYLIDLLTYEDKV